MYYNSHQVSRSELRGEAIKTGKTLPLSPSLKRRPKKETPKKSKKRGKEKGHGDSISTMGKSFSSIEKRKKNLGEGNGLQEDWPDTQQG